MALATELTLEDFPGCRAHPFGTLEEIVDAELAIGAMLGRPMCLDREALIAASGSRMSGDERAALEDLNRMSGEARIDALADQSVMHRVVSAADFDMMILVDAGADFPVRIVVAARRQGSCDGFLFGLEHAVS